MYIYICIYIYMYIYIYVYIYIYIYIYMANMITCLSWLFPSFDQVAAALYVRVAALI